MDGCRAPLTRVVFQVQHIGRAGMLLVIEALFVQNVGGEFARNWLLPAEEGP